MKITNQARPRSSRAGEGRFADISALRQRLPRYWWAEVSRVRALIAKDADTALFEAGNLEIVAGTLHAGDEEVAREHAVALWQASRQLTAIAQAQASRRSIAA